MEEAAFCDSVLCATILLFFTARRYASEVQFIVVVCPSVCLVEVGPFPPLSSLIGRPRPLPPFPPVPL